MAVAVWSMLSAASLTLGLLHAISWLRERTQWANLAFALAAAAVSVVAPFELALMRVALPETPELPRPTP